VFAATVICTCPAPVPDVADRVIQLTLLLAVQPQPDPVVTDRGPPPPVAGTFWLDGATLNVHPAACAIEIVRSEIETDP
jgi:hypothetical protein